MTNIFLDDERQPEDVTWVDIGEGPWTILRDQKSFELWIETQGIPDKISFDNDLGTGMGEGIFCVNWLIEAVLDGRVAWRTFTYTIHSKNPVAARLIKSKLDQFSEHMNNQLVRGE